MGICLIDIIPQSVINVVVFWHQTDKIKIIRRDFVFNYKIALNRTELDQKARKKVALLMAIATAPYPFFMPILF